MSRVEVTRGSSLRLEYTFRNPDASAVDLTGATLLPFDVTPTIADRLTATVSNAIGGEIEVYIDGETPLPIGPYTFRLQVLAAGLDPTGFPEFRFVVT